MKQVGRTVASGCVGAVGGFAAFGLLLAIAWQFPFGDSVRYKAVTVLLAAGAGFALGGYVAGLLAGRRRALHGGVFVLLFGSFAFGYVLGRSWLLLLAVPLTGLLGSLGGWLAADR